MTAPLALPVRAVDGGAAADPPPPPDGSDPSAAQSRALAVRRARFDFDLEERAEMEREANALRDLMIAQLKAEDGYLHKWIEMI